MRNMFDLNRDGKMSAFERGVEAEFLHRLFDEKKENQKNSKRYVGEVENREFRDMWKKRNDGQW